MVVDYDDALLHQYDTHPNPWVCRLLGRKIATVMRGARRECLPSAGSANRFAYAAAGSLGWRRRWLLNGSDRACRRSYMRPAVLGCAVGALEGAICSDTRF